MNSWDFTPRLFSFTPLFSSSPRPRVPDLGNFLTSNTGVGPYGKVIPTLAHGSGLNVADAVQLSSDGGVSWFHMVAAYQYVNSQWTIVGHDTDRLNYPINNYLLVYTLQYIQISGWRS